MKFEDLTYFETAVVWKNCKDPIYFLCISIFNLDCSGSGRKGGLVPGVSPDGFDDGGESKAVVNDYKFKLQKAEQDINTLQTNVSRTKDSFITTWTEMSFWGADHRSPTFPELLVIKPVITQGTKRYQMTDMDMIFLPIPISLLWVKWFGYYRLSKSSIFSKC